MRIIGLITIILFQISCTNQQEEKQVENNDTTRIIGVAKAKEMEDAKLVKTIVNYHLISEDDPFIEFFKRFNEDSTFHINHITYPLVRCYVNIDGDSDTAIIKKGKAIYSNLLLQYEGLEKLELLVTQKNGLYSVEQRGVDVGILIIYYFKNIDGEWMLIRIEDMST